MYELKSPAATIEERIMQMESSFGPVPLVQRANLISTFLRHVNRRAREVDAGVDAVDKYALQIDASVGQLLTALQMDEGDLKANAEKSATVVLLHIARDFDRIYESVSPDERSADNEWLTFYSTVTELDNGPVLNSINERRYAIEAAAEQSEKHLKEIADVKTKMEEALARAEESAKQAGRAATFAGAGALESSFTTYAADERALSNKFRTATIWLLGAVVVAAGVLYFVPVIDTEQNSAVAHAITRIAVIVALGTLAGYLARQSGQHRKQAMWAEAITVQLASFLSFIEDLEGEARSSVYEMFAKRVLGEPASTATSAADMTSVPMQTFVDVVTKAQRAS